MMRIVKNGRKWTVRWRQLDELTQTQTPRRYWADTWGEAIGFAGAQLRAMRPPMDLDQQEKAIALLTRVHDSREARLYFADFNDKIGKFLKEVSDGQEERKKAC